MVRFNDKIQIDKPANNDILPITDMSDTSDDRKVTVEQLSRHTIENISALSDGKVLTDNNLTNELKAKYDSSLNNSNVSNCVLVAPNGLLEYSGKQFTVKSKLEYLTGDGRNADLTFRNKKNILAQNLQINIDEQIEKMNYLFIVNGKLDYCGKGYLATTYDKIEEKKPLAVNGFSQVWFDIAKNEVLYSAKASNKWVKTNDLVVLAKFQVSTDAIIAIEKYYPLELIKRSDLDKLDLKADNNSITSNGHVIGEFVPFTTSANWLPEGFIPANGSEFSSDGIFHELWNKFLIPNSEVKKPLKTPIFDSNNTDGFIISDSRDDVEAYTIFNGVKSKAIGRWNSYWYKLACPIESFCNYYTITSSLSTPVNYPTDWKLQGSMNGSKWDDIENVKDQVFTAGETKTFIVNSTIKYKYYLITFISGVEGDNNGLIGKIHFYLNDTTTILDTCTYEEYDATLLEYGACPKWAVDERQGKFKVPTIPTGYFIEQGEGTVYKAGLPNITGEWNGYSGFGGLNPSNPIGAMYTVKSNGKGSMNDGKDSKDRLGFNASLSNPIYGQSDTVQPKSVGLRWFIYVANSQLNTSAIDWNLFIDGLNKAGTGLEIGDIGIAPLGINESENLRRYLNGQTILQSQFKIFTKRLKQKQLLYPNLFCDNDRFELELTMSAKGQCGKFVIDDVAGTIRLPKVINIQGLFDLQNAGLRVEAGLPNITGGVNMVPAQTTELNKQWGSGAFKKTRTSSWNNCQSGGGSQPTVNSVFDASDSDPTYGKSETVQEEAIQYPYFIQVATGATEKDSVINEYQLNNPYSLLDCKWSDHKLTNISWLLSDGQLKSGTTYKAVYDLLLKEYNSSTDITEELFGVSITYRKGKETGLRITTNKTAYDNLLEKTGTAWFYVLDTAQTGFYLPQTNGMLQFGGTGEFVEAGLPNITGSQIVGLLSEQVPAKGCIRKDWSVAPGSPTNGAQRSGYSIDASLSNPIYGKSETVQPNAVKGYLYFYAGETVENANLIDAGKMQGQLIIKADKTEVAHLSMPSDRFDDLVLGASGTTYTAPADGYYAIQNLVNANGYITFQVIKSSKMLYSVITQHTGGNSLLAPVTKGATLKVFYQNTAGAKDNFFRFIYAEGSSK